MAVNLGNAWREEREKKKRKTIVDWMSDIGAQKARSLLGSVTRPCTLSPKIHGGATYIVYGGCFTSVKIKRVLRLSQTR